MPSRVESNGPAAAGNGGATPPMRSRPDMRSAGSSGHVRSRSNGAQLDSDSSGGRRPLSAPGDKEELTITTTNGDTDPERGTRLAKPLLLRSKSEHGLVREEVINIDRAEDEHYEWGARHGFEEHYESEDIISQLANVGVFAFRHSPALEEDEPGAW